MGTVETREMFTSRNRAYSRFIRAVLYPQGLHAFFRASDSLASSRRILDAGCGTGALTFAVLEAARAQGAVLPSIDAFDLAPAMLERLRENVLKRGLTGIRLAEANVLELDRLPPDWRDYDLVVSSAMLEYLPKERLSDALAALRARLKRGGSIVVFISRRNVLMKWLIESWWSSNLYTQSELVDSFGRAGLSCVPRRFPSPYTHLNLWGFVVEARVEDS